MATSLSSVPSWSIALLLLILVSVSLSFEILLHAIQRNFEKKKKKALLTFLAHVRNELLLVGFISLFLSVFQVGAHAL